MENLAPKIFVSSDSYEYPDPSIAYTAGLLWPVGKMVISRFHQNSGCSALDDITPPLTPHDEKHTRIYSFGCNPCLDGEMEISLPDDFTD